MHPVHLIQGVVFAAWAVSTPSTARAAEVGSRPYGTLELAVRYNPAGAAILAEAGATHVFEQDAVHHVPARSLSVGARANVNPADAAAGVIVRVRPFVFAEVALAYDRYGYFGANGALLSFPTAESDFGDDARSDRSGEAVSAGGDRFTAGLTLNAISGDFYARNETRFERFHFGGGGPWFYEWEHDTLLEATDWVAYEKAFASVAAWKGAERQLLLLGPTFDATHSFGRTSTRYRIGGAAYLALEPGDWTGQPHFLLEIGSPVRDQNRKGEIYLMALGGSSW
ncbi:MAG: hypothetical protein AB7K71_33295 [Polyangiaceae bacterium]